MISNFIKTLFGVSETYKNQGEKRIIVAAFVGFGGLISILIGVLARVLLLQPDVFYYVSLLASSIITPIMDLARFEILELGQN